MYNQRTYDALADSLGGMEIQKLTDGSWVIFHAESGQYYCDKNLELLCFPTMNEARIRMKELAGGLYSEL